jgi:hypothetical protein
MMFIDSRWWWCWTGTSLWVQRVLEVVAGNAGTCCIAGSKYLNRVQVQNCSFSFEQQSKQTQMKMKQDNRTTNNNWRIIMNADEQTIITNTSNDYERLAQIYNWVNHEHLIFTATGLNVTVLALHRVKLSRRLQNQ